MNTDNKIIIRDLGSGLILRRAVAADAEALVAFNAWLHGNIETGKPDERVGAWTRDLMERPHPTFNLGDFTIVEDTTSGKIVSTLNIISQTWTYGGIPFGVGRPELVGTHPDYRNRGLVRAQFEVVHQWSAERGEKMQAITGIPYYYRLFGYEMALSLSGGRIGYPPHVPELDGDQGESYSIRLAKEADIAFIDQCYRQASQRSLVSCVWAEELWRYEIGGKSPDNVNRSELRLIESPAGEPVGFFAHPVTNWGPTLATTFYELIAGVSWLEPTYSLIRYLEKTAKIYASEEKDAPDYGAFAFWLGTDHPVYQLISDRLPRVRQPYAWYIRIPDLPDFVTHIKPVLEHRLAHSPMSGYSGELKMTFYRDGLRLVIEAGSITGVESWKPTPVAHSGDAAFPGLTFLQLLLGYRSIEDLQYAFADCRIDNDRARALLNILFPKQASNVWPVS